MGEAVRDGDAELGEVGRSDGARAASAKETVRVVSGELGRVRSIATRVLAVDGSGSLPIRVVAVGDGAGEVLNRGAQLGMLVELRGELGGSSIGA
jgi:hypothetical protein